VSGRSRLLRVRHWPVGTGQSAEGNVTRVKPCAASRQLAGGRRRALDDLVVAVRSGQSSSLVLQGEPGVGKTALLEYVVQHEGCYRVLSVAGVQAEIEPSPDCTKRWHRSSTTWRRCKRRSVRLWRRFSV
jgi:hypothetical protein